MLKKYFLLLLLIPLVLPACKEEVAPIAEPQVEAEVIKPSSYVAVVETQTGQSHAFNVELALTPAEQSKGLMHRTTLKDDAGMLFYFGNEREQSFWMKNTLIPLDIIFIKQTGRIHHIHENAIPRDLTPIPSKGEVSAVLEINGGMSRKLGIQPGDTVKHQFFTQNLAQ